LGSTEVMGFTGISRTMSHVGVPRWVEQSDAAIWTERMPGEIHVLRPVGGLASWESVFVGDGPSDNVGTLSSVRAGLALNRRSLHDEMRRTEVSLVNHLSVPLFSSQQGTVAYRP
jgi:hypothetical protein